VLQLVSRVQPVEASIMLNATGVSRGAAGLGVGAGGGSAEAGLAGVDGVGDGVTAALATGRASSLAAE
jgi:hypothetical protein